MGRLSMIASMEKKPVTVARSKLVMSFGKGVVARHALCDDLDQIVPIAADAIEIDDLGQALDMGAEAVGPVLGVMTCADHHENGQVVPERLQVDIDLAVADDAFGGQPLQAAPAGVLRQADSLGKIALRYRPVLCSQVRILRSILSILSI